MKKEISAGGCIVRRSPKGWEILRVRDMNGQWTFPKGKIEPGESDSEAALREIKEEVGLERTLTLVGTLTPLHYIYTRNGPVDKTVRYFVFTYEGTETPVGQREEGIHDPQWVALSEVSSDIGYPASNRPLIDEVMRIISAL